VAAECDGAENCAALYRKTRPDLVITAFGEDEQGRMKGPEVAEAIRGEDPGALLVAECHSGGSEPDLDALEGGICEFFHMPARPDELNALLGKVLDCADAVLPLKEGIASKRGNRVMLADPDAAVRSLYRNTLGKNGYVTVAETGEGSLCLPLYHRAKPDLVIMDLRLSGKLENGLRVIRAIKREEPSAKIMVCSELAGADVTAQAVGLGAGAYVIKPVKASELMTRVERLCPTMGW